ncbi:hypothetical protein [Lactobacillus equicursoris]|uniref:hypothetical protein n=1 Tax=Lactobacillus equicursoris TaxID=420645 RepID=UPI001EE1E354|nr:hypothetical protein [Lactobacillus equicursoris]
MSRFPPKERRLSQSTNPEAAVFVLVPFSVVRRIIEDYKLAEHLKRWDDRGKGLLLDLAKYQN